jgi:hypothetical protein
MGYAHQVLPTVFSLCSGAVLSSPALAGNTCLWGNDAGTNVLIQPHDEAFAEVIIDNRLTARRKPVCEVVLFGVPVQIEYLQRPSTAPDDFVVTVPSGFRADPAEITIDDFDTDSVLIWIDEGVGM